MRHVQEDDPIVPAGLSPRRLNRPVHMAIQGSESIYCIMMV